MVSNNYNNNQIASNDIVKTEKVANRSINTNKTKISHQLEQVQVVQAAKTLQTNPYKKYNTKTTSNITTKNTKDNTIDNTIDEEPSYSKLNMTTPTYQKASSPTVEDNDTNLEDNQSTQMNGDVMLKRTNNKTSTLTSIASNSEDDITTMNNDKSLTINITPLAKKTLIPIPISQANDAFTLFPSIKEQVIVRKKIKRWHPFIQFGIHTIQGQDMQGIRGQLGIDYNISSRWSVGLANQLAYTKTTNQSYTIGQLPLINSLGDQEFIFTNLFKCALIYEPIIKLNYNIIYPITLSCGIGISNIPSYHKTTYFDIMGYEQLLDIEEYAAVDIMKVGLSFSNTPHFNSSLLYTIDVKYQWKKLYLKAGYDYSKQQTITSFTILNEDYNWQDDMIPNHRFKIDLGFQF